MNDALKFREMITAYGAKLAKPSRKLVDFLRAHGVAGGYVGHESMWSSASAREVFQVGSSAATPSAKVARSKIGVPP